MFSKNMFHKNNNQRTLEKNIKRIDCKSYGKSCCGCNEFY